MNPHKSLPFDNPVLVELSRGDMVESVHRGAAAIVASDGSTLFSIGDVDRHVFARSAIKPLQALPLIESGAADHFQLSNKQLALASSSHNGEPIHVDTVQRWLNQIGLDDDALQCAAHWPYDAGSQRGMAALQQSPTGAHNNCSGKHTGFLTTAVHLGESTRDYISPDHPVQQRVRQTLSEMTGVDLTQAPRGIDGCGIPVIGISLRASALAMARFGDAQAVLSTTRADAATRIYQACVEEPYMVAGNTRFCSLVMQDCGSRVLVKTGAEGVFCATVPERRIGIAVKIDDGGKRGAETVIAAILDALLAGPQSAPRVHEQLAAWINAPVKNVADRVVGHHHLSSNWISSLNHSIDRTQ